MDKPYRVILGLFVTFFGILFLILTNLFRSDSIEQSTTSDTPFYPLVFIIAILVVIVVPSIFVVVRLIRR